MRVDSTLRLQNDIAQVDADAEQNPAVFRSLGVQFRQAALPRLTLKMSERHCH